MLSLQVLGFRLYTDMTCYAFGATRDDAASLMSTGTVIAFVAFKIMHAYEQTPWLRAAFL